MKNKILSLSLILVLFGLFTACSSDDEDVETRVEFPDLPPKSQTLLSTSFPDAEILSVKKEEDKGRIEYEVKLKNGFELDFDADGNWTSINGHGQPIPEELILTPIVEYVQANYPGAFIDEIEKKSTRYEVDLSNDVDLYFDLDGNFVAVNH